MINCSIRARSGWHAHRRAIVEIDEIRVHARVARVVGIPAIDGTRVGFRARRPAAHVLPAVIFEFLGSVNWTINSTPSRNVCTFNLLTPAFDLVD